MNSKDIRIGKFLSQAGLCSRRKAADFLKQHQINFLGERIMTPDYKIEAALVSGEKREPVLVDGHAHFWESETQIILLNKPAGYICSHRDYKKHRSVFELLPRDKQNYFYAGRLDVLSRGLMLFSNDGELIQSLTHPSFRVIKLYHIRVYPRLDAKSIKRCIEGIHSDGEKLRFMSITPLVNQETKRKEVSTIGRKRAWSYRVELGEGRNREIRRVMKSLGRDVADIQRIQIGAYYLGELKEGGLSYVTHSSTHPS